MLVPTLATWLTCAQSGKPRAQDGAKIKEPKKKKEKKKEAGGREFATGWTDSEIGRDRRGPFPLKF